MRGRAARLEERGALRGGGVPRGRGAGRGGRRNVKALVDELCRAQPGVRGDVARQRRRDTYGEGAKQLTHPVAGPLGAGILGLCGGRTARPRPGGLQSGDAGGRRAHPLADRGAGRGSVGRAGRARRRRRDRAYNTPVFRERSPHRRHLVLCQAENMGNHADDRRRELYRSPNGDTWFLGREPKNGHAFVIHQPNRPSGGGLSQSNWGPS